MASESWNMECGAMLGIPDQEIGGALLMSLLEDTATQGEDGEQEKLGSVIQSLEAEINKINGSNNDNNIHGSSTAHHLEWNRDDDCFELMNQDVRMLEYTSQGNIHESYSFDWPADMEMAAAAAAAVYTTYSNAMELWEAADSIADHQIIVGLGEDYSQFYYGEEEQQQDQQLYCSLWQETYDY